MTGHTSARRRAIVLAAIVAVGAVGAPAATNAQTAASPGSGREILMMSTDAIIVPIKAVLAGAEAAIDRRVVMHWGSARGDLRTSILAGAPFDLAILLPDVNEQLRAAGRITDASHAIASVDIGIGQRGGRAAIDVGTPAALKQAFLGAKSLRWARTGAALFTVNRILDTLDVRAAAVAKHRPDADTDLAEGEYELQIFPMSEILPRKELRNLGPVVAALQVPAVMTAVISSATRDPEGARALIAFLQGPAIEPALRRAGFSR